MLSSNPYPREPLLLDALISKLAEKRVRDRFDIFSMSFTKEGEKRLRQGKRPKRKHVKVGVAPSRSQAAFIFPGGGVDPGESLKQGARREFAEETPKKARVLKRLKQAPTYYSPYSKSEAARKGAKGSRTHYALATEGKRSKTYGSAGDALELTRIKAKKALRVLKGSSHHRAKSQRKALKLAVKAFLKRR
jgi:ADP-ribose pyrophosphatase YjhB (NUDIX family)